MAYTDPVVLYYYDRRGTWILKRGNETFWNDKDEMLEWNTPEEAVNWAWINLGIVVPAEPPINTLETSKKPHQIPIIFDEQGK